MGIPKLDSEEQFNAFVKKESLTLVHFHASWAPQCEQLNTVIADLQEDINNTFTAAYIDAEGVPTVSLKYKITAAPTVLLFKNGAEVARINGFQPGEIKMQIIQNTNGTSTPSVAVVPTTNEDLNTRLKHLVTSKKLMLFMKGDRRNPQCGFSRQTIELLDGINADYGTFDILGDEDIRQGLKKFSNWPTYPQLYLDGELIGGLDVIREELQDQEFLTRIPKKEALNDRLKRLINGSKLMLFMKGNTESPKCGFSKQTIELLNKINADYKTFDILSDDEVRQGLKEFSNWPTYPQLYLDGELIGGLDVIREELQDQEFLSKIPTRS